MAKATKKSEHKQAGKKGKAKKKQDEPTGIARFPVFAKDSWAEFKRIQWPTPKQAINESAIVLFTVIFIIALVKVYDIFSNFLLGFILK